MTEYLVPHSHDDDPNPGRTIYPEELRMAEPGWARPWWGNGESVARREGDVEQEELEAAREWLQHVEAGRISYRHELNS